MIYKAIMFCFNTVTQTAEYVFNGNTISQNVPMPPSINININREDELNVSNITEYEETKKFIYRPKFLNEYIGQEKAKNLVKLNIRKINEIRFVHFLLSGFRGCGKTTLAHIIKNQLNADMIECVAGELTRPEHIIEKINQINNSTAEKVILFIDEIHSLNPNLAETLYSVMEDYTLSGKHIKPFILMGATTEKNILMEKLAPFVDRFQVQIELEEYKIEDIVEILKQYKYQLYENKNVPVNNMKIIAENCKATPRVAISLMEDNLVEKNINQVLQYHRILKDGLTDIDLKILEALEELDRPVGESALAQLTNMNRKDYSSLFEPYLISKRYILRTPRGRVITEKGIQFLKEFKI